MGTTTNGDAPREITTAGAYPGFVPPEAHELPSGAVFLLTRPRLTQMIRRGQIPNPMQPIVDKIFEMRDENEVKAEADLKGMSADEIAEQRARDETDPDVPRPPGPSEEELNELVKSGVAYSIAELTVWSCILKPEVEMEPTVDNTPLTANGKLSFDALAPEDVNYILQWANTEVADLARFPAKPASPDGGDGGGEVEHPAEPVTGVPA